MKGAVPDSSVRTKHWHWNLSSSGQEVEAWFREFEGEARGMIIAIADTNRSRSGCTCSSKIEIIAVGTACGQLEPAMIFGIYI
jgi:hypothetical protein